MKIAKIDVFNFDLTYVHGVYKMSGGRDITSLPSTLVRVTSDDGRDGWGEVCPLGSTYLPAHAGGARAALQLIAPALLGIDPTNLAAVNDAHSTSCELESLAGELDAVYEEVSLLHDVARHLRISLDPSELASLCLNRLHRSLGSAGCAVLLKDPNRPGFKVPTLAQL